MSYLTAIKSTFEHRVNKDELILKHCPYCNNERWNFQISVSKKIFHCWVCNESGRMNKFLKCVGLDIGGEDEYVEDYILKKENLSTLDTVKLDTHRVISYNTCSSLFQSKGITQSDIITYGFKFGTVKHYKDKLLMPLYEGNRLVYIVARDITVEGRYYNMVDNKSLYMPYYLGNRDKYCIYLCEGIFDAISVHKLGFTAGVLLGTSISRDQIHLLGAFGFHKIVVCLDGDVKDRSFKMVDTLRWQGFDCGIVLFNDDEDPNDIYVKDQNRLDAMLQQPKFGSLLFEKMSHKLLGSC